MTGNGRSVPDSSFRFPCSIKVRRGSAAVSRNYVEPGKNITARQCVFRATARALRDRVDGARDRALYYRDILLPLHERIVNEAQLQYNAMQLGPFQLLRAREQQIQTAVAYIESLRDYWLARADVEQILSGRLPNSRLVSTRTTSGQSGTLDSEEH